MLLLFAIGKSNLLLTIKNNGVLIMTFKAGVSGNEKGRPKNTGHRQKLFTILVEPHKEKLFETAINLALGGSEAMLRLFLERMLPAKPSDDEVSFDLPCDDIKKTDALLAYGEHILKAVAQSDLTPEQAKTILSTLEMQRKQIESCELADRVASIEQVLKHRKR